jgi:branched-chain amino acid transport system ATP-binding protein
VVDDKGSISDDIARHLGVRKDAARADLAVTLATMTPEVPAVALVDVESVSVQFDGLKALSTVSFSVSSGEIVGLIGPNGAGKTTAFNVICGFVRPSTGHVRFPAAGKSNLKPNQLARAGVARTLQGVGLFPHMSIVENVMAGGQIRRHGDFFTSLLALPTGIHADRKLRADAMVQLDRLGVAQLARRLPAQIPYGESKKVALARALMCDPSLLLLDEPASGLDEAELEEFASLITGLREAMGVLLVEHDMGFVMPLVDRLVVLDFGEVIARGKPREIQSDPAVIAAYLGVEAT